jgi:hypothetical protein
MPMDGAHQFPQPVRFGKSIGIQGGDPGRCRLPGREIVGRGKAEIGAGCHNLHRYRQGVDPVERTIGRPVIDDDDFAGWQGLGGDRTQASDQVIAAVVVNDNDADRSRAHYNLCPFRIVELTYMAYPIIPKNYLKMCIQG